MKKFKVFLLGFLLVFLLSFNVHSTSYDFTMGSNSSIDVSDTADFLSLYADVDSGVAGKAFTLEEGATERFRFGTIGTFERTIDWDDRQPGSLTAYLDFESPELIEAIGGTSVGFTGGWVFKTEGWKVDWETNPEISFGHGGLFSIELEDLYFSDYSWSAPNIELDLFANITLIDAPAHAPEPSTMILFGLGLLGFGVVARKKFRNN